MFPTRKALFRFYCAPAGEGRDLPGGDAAEDYGDGFTPTDDEAGAGAGTDDDDAGEGTDKGSADEGSKDESGEGLRDAADAAADGDDKGAKDTGTPKTGKGKFIPLDRHEKLLKKERERREAAEAQLQQGRAGQQVVKANELLETVENELVAMEEKYNELLAEGDTKGAAQMMTSIRRKNAELQTVTAEQRDAEVMARAVEKVRYDEALDRIEQEYPELDPESDDYDEDKYQDVVDLMQAGQRRGLSATKALQRAVARTMGAETAGQKRATTVQPRVDEKDVAGQRRAEAVKRNLEVAGKQPPATHKAGAGNDVAGGALTAKAVMDMSDAEFDKLSPKDLAKLRGDTL